MCSSRASRATSTRSATFRYAYYEPHKAKMKAVGIDWGKGQGCVTPSNENVLAGTYNPLSRPLFIYVSKKSADKPEVKQFVEFAMTKGPALIKEVKYLPLPDRGLQDGARALCEGPDRLGLRRRARGRPAGRWRS